MRARESAKSDAWTEARGRNRVTRVLDGCGIEESFTAEGPGQPWAGKSLSMFSEREGKWRQTWIDDTGSYLAFVGERRGDEVVLEREPRQREGVVTQMRMVFTDITPSHLRWRWERTTDGGATWTPMMLISYTRRS